MLKELIILIIINLKLMIFLYDTLLITFDGDIQGNNKKWNIL